MIIIKSKREIELMREAGKVVAEVFNALEPFIKPGVNTEEIDQLAEKVIRSYGGIPASKGYYGYPGAICVSVNDTLVHGIPSKKIVLHDGDIVSCDVVVSLHGYHADACRTYLVGVCKQNAINLVKVTQESFFEAVKLIKPGVHLGDISHLIQTYNESHGYSLPRDYTGHGIGKEMHEDPYVPNYGENGTGPVLQEGMTLAIEPMVAEGDYHTRVLGDGWTVKMKDGKLSSHYENTIVVTSDGYEILTMLEGGKSANGKN